MKKFTLAMLALTVSCSALADADADAGGDAGGAANAITGGAAATTAATSVAKSYTYTVSATPRDERLFVKNDFDLTLSANVQLQTNETERSMATGTVNTNGRNVFTGHSDGGSVSACGEPLTAAAAKESGALATALGDRFDIASNGGCK